MDLAITNNVFPCGPGQSYGGERIIGYLVEALANLGHRVWFFSPKGTVPPDNIEDYIPVSEMRNDIDVYYEAALKYQIEKGVSWDIYQTNYFGEGYNPDVRFLAKQTCEVVWNRWCHRKPFFGKEPEAPNIISYSKLLQQDLLASDVSSTMIHYGLPKDLYTFSPEHDGYAVFIGKLEGGKRPDLAIRLALAAGLKIVVMGPPYNTGCFWSMVAPYIDNEKVFWVRGVDDEQKQKIMSRARVFISSNDDSWREHFGIVNGEALAMGVPVLGFNRINQDCAIVTDKIIEDGKQGFILNYTTSSNLEEILDKGVPLLNRINEIDRASCRNRFEEMFTADLSARRYEYLYDYILENGNVDSLEVPF